MWIYSETGFIVSGVGNQVQGYVAKQARVRAIRGIATFVGEANDRSHIMIDDFASSAKIVNELNGVSRGQVDDDGDIIGSAKKLIDDITNKVLNHRETTVSVIANDYERSSALVNSGSCTSSKKVNKVNCGKPNGFEKIPDGKESFRAQLSIDDKITPKSDAENVLASRKRKLESHSFSGMLEWLIHAAKHSGDPSVGSVPECSKWGDRNGEFWADTLFVRDALLIKRHASKAAGEVLQKVISLSFLDCIMWFNAMRSSHK